MKHIRCSLLIVLGIAYLTNSKEDPPVFRYAKDGKPMCLCPRNLDPLCGTDNRTYANKCEFECQKKSLEQRGLETIDVASYGRCDDSIDIKSFLKQVHETLDDTNADQYNKIDMESLESLQDDISLEPVIY